MESIEEKGLLRPLNERIQRIEDYIRLTSHGMPAIKAYRELWEKSDDDK